MKASLLALLLSGAAWLGSPQQAAAQTSSKAKAKAADTQTYIPWFTVQNQSLVVRNGGQSKPLDKDITLPNGIRVEHRTHTLVLTSGKRVVMNEGDVLSLNGEFSQKQPDAAPAMASAASTPAPAAPAPAAPTAAVATAPTPTPAPPAPATPAAAPTPAVRAFTYSPAAPVKGTLKGVVELGSSGFNMFIVRVDAKRNWKLEKAEFGNSLVMEKMATEEDIRAGLKAYIGQMLDFGVNGRDIHFVVSSGAVMSDVTARIVKGLEGLKYVVNTVTAEREGTLGLRVALLPEYTDKAFVLDIGSGNTKISWVEDGKPRVLETFGAKYYQNQVDDATVAAAVKAKAAQVPARLRGTCFVLGGVPYELAKAVRQGQEPYTVLGAADAYAQLSGAKNKAGLNIYQSVAAATGCQQFVFAYDSNFTIGYLLSLP